MLNYLARKFSSLWSLLTYPLRMIWMFITKIFTEREFTILDLTNGTVSSFKESSFWRFTKFCVSITLFMWAMWSTYVFVYHRPLLQKRTRQLEETKVLHARQLSDVLTYLKKFNDLAHSLNVLDYNLLKSKKMTETEKDAIIKKRAATWGEMDFLQTRVSQNFSNLDYVPEFKKMSEIYVEYDLTRAENDILKKQNQELTDSITTISDMDNQIVGLVSELSSDKIKELRGQLGKVKNELVKLGLTENTLVDKANKFENNLVGAAFIPLQVNDKMDEKYKKLAKSLELWHGLTRIKKLIPIGAPVSKVRITSRFGVRSDPFDHTPKKHKGIDFAGKIGTELFTVIPGRVVSAGERVGYGKTVEVEHGLGFSTLYAHLSKINVSRGDWVQAGTIVGLAGSSGRSTGPHLHYEIRYHGTPFDPEKFIKEK